MYLPDWAKNFKEPRTEIKRINNGFYHIVSFVVRKLGNHRDFFIGFCFAGNGFVIDHNFRMENLLFYDSNF